MKIYKINIRPKNDNDEAHGYWERYDNNRLAYKCFYKNGDEVGYEEWHTVGELRKRYHIL